MFLVCNSYLSLSAKCLFTIRNKQSASYNGAINYLDIKLEQVEYNHCIIENFSIFLTCVCSECIV